MPEKKDLRSSGRKPEEKQETLRPTVIKPSGGDTQTPTISGGAAKPKKLAGPTVIEVGASGARDPGARSSKIDRPPPRSPKVKGPTAISGVERRRIPVSLDDLRKLLPNAEPEILERALRLIETDVVEEETDRNAVLWGHRIQQDYSDLVSETLSLSQADVLKRVAGYVNRTMEILGSIDLMAICGIAGSTGVLGHYLKIMTKKIDTPEELEAARVELDQLVKLMGAALEDLLILKEKLERHSSQIGEIGDESEAAALGAEFLSAYLRSSEPRLSRHFLERSMSLTQTAVQIRGSISMRDTQIEQPLRLIGTIQNVALVMMPGWLGSIASLTTLARERKPTPTEAGELAYQLRNILQQLQT